MLTSGHLWTYISFSVYFLVSPSGSGQQETPPGKSKRHARTNIGELTTYEYSPALNMSPEFPSGQKHTTVFFPLNNANVVNREKEKNIHKKSLENTSVIVDKNTVPSSEHVGTQSLQETPAQRPTNHGRFQRGRYANFNVPTALPVRTSRIRKSSADVGIASTGGEVNPTKNNNETYLADENNTNTNNYYQEDTTAVYIQLGTEWIHKCFNDNFCYQKCERAASDNSADQDSNPDFIQGDQIFCSRAVFYGDICSCDLECIVYGDCCPDVFLHCWNSSDLETIISVINNTRNVMLLPDTKDDLADLLSLGTDSIEKILVNVYARFGSCRQVTYGKNKQFIQSVGRCPPNVENSLKIKCEASVSPLLPPVHAHVGKVGIEFYNVYCALCHGIREEQLTAFTSQINCPSIVANNSDEDISLSDLVEFIENSLCNLTFSDTSSPCDHRPCQEKHILKPDGLQQLSASVQTGQCLETDALLCSSYVYPVDGFKNPHCRKCLVSSLTVSNANANQTYILHNNSCLNDIVLPAKTNGGIYLFLDVSGTYVDSKGTVKTKYPCEGNEVFDVLTQECKLLVCPRRQQAFRGQCRDTRNGQLNDELHVGSTPTWKSLQIVIWSLSAQLSCQNFSLQHLHNIAPDLIIKAIFVKHSREEFASMINKEIHGRSENESLCTDNWESEASDETNTTSIEILIVLRHDLDLATVEQLKQLSRSINAEEFKMNISSSFDGYNFTTFCQNATTVVNSTEHQGRVYVMVNSTRQPEVSYLLQSLGYELRISKTKDKFQITETVYLCEDSGLFSREDCRVVTYTLNETMLNSSGLYVIKSGQLYEVNDFEIKGDLVYVCSQFQFPTRLEELGGSAVTMVLNLVFSSISIMFLLSMVIIYCVFPSLQTLAGKMTASLAATMGLVFVANILTFLETRNQYACPVVAVVSHVALLSQFGWMSAIAVNMAVTFGPSTLNNVLLLNSSAHFRRYNCIVYCVSLTIVLVPGILDFLHDDHHMVRSPCSNESSDANLSERSQTLFSCQVISETFDYPRYGYPVCSWFSGPLWSRLAFVVVPFAISYIINIVCFITTLVGIYKSSKMTKKLGKSSSDRLQCVIYIKLSTAMGFTWLLSLLGNVLQDTQVIAYLFTVLILLQGVCLFLAFMANKRVFALIHGRWLSAGMSEQSTSGATSKSRLYTSSTG